MWYRIPFFKEVAKLYNVCFIFTRADRIKGLEGVQYEVLNTYFGFAFGLIPKLLKRDYDILVNGEPGGLAGIIETLLCFIITKLRRKIHIMWTERYAPPLKSFSWKVISFLYRLIISHSDAILVPGIRHKKYVLSLGASNEKVFIMPNVSDLLLKKVDSREVEEIRKRLGVSNKKIVLFVGRLVELKGLQYLIPAFAKLLKDRGDVELLIIGDGPYKKKLQEFYKKFNVENNVRFLGWIDHEKLAPYYLMCNVVVIPSIVIPSMFKGGNIGDAYSLVTHEAASFGKPIIVTDAVGSAHSLVCSGVNGFVVPQRDIDALYDAMRIILCNSELEKKMGEESKKIVSKGFMYEHMVNGFKEAIEYVKAIRCRPKNFSSVRCKR